MKEAIKKSLQEEKNKQTDKAGKEREKPQEYPANKEEEFKLMQSILHSLNQDENAVKKIAEAVNEH